MLYRKLSTHIRISGQNFGLVGYSLQILRNGSFSRISESFTALTDFKFWANVLEERACARNWSETKALTWVQKLETRLDMAKDYPGIALAFSPFLDGVAKKTSDAETDVSLCLDAATIFRKFSECLEEKEIISILRDTLKKTRKAYIQTYRQTEIKRQIYKESLMCLKSLIGSKEIVTQLALRVKVKDVANQFMKALEREQELRANLNTVSEKYKSATKQEAIRKLQYFLDTWRKRFLVHIARTFFSTQNKCNPYLETYKRLFKIYAEDAVEVIFDCNSRRTDMLRTHISTDVGIDVKKLLGFEQKVSSLALKVQNKVSYSDLSTFVKREVLVVLDHAARGKHEFNIKKGMVIHQLTEANEFGLAVGFSTRTFRFTGIKTGFFPVKCAVSDPRHIRSLAL